VWGPDGRGGAAPVPVAVREFPDVEDLLPPDAEDLLDEVLRILSIWWQVLTARCPRGNAA